LMSVFHSRYSTIIHSGVPVEVFLSDEASKRKVELIVCIIQTETLVGSREIKSRYCTT
jgi:hypothetical protein